MTKKAAAIFIIVVLLFLVATVAQARDSSTSDDTKTHVFEVGNMTCVAIRTQWEWTTPAIDGISCDWDEYTGRETR